MVIRAPAIYALYRVLINAWFATPDDLDFFPLFLVQSFSHVTQFFHTTLARGSIQHADFPEIYYDPGSPNLYEYAFA